MSLITHTKHQNKPCKSSTATHNTNTTENDKYSVLNITAFYKLKGFLKTEPYSDKAKVSDSGTNPIFSCNSIIKANTHMSQNAVTYPHT